MEKRVEEVKGQLKKGVGTLTGNEKLQQEGEAQADAAKLEREAEGAADQAVGKVEETVGVVTDDTETELKGKGRQAEGDIERAG